MRRGALENKHPIVMNVCIGLASGFAGFRIQPHRYVVNLSSKKAKNTPKSIEWYRPIAKKQLVFIEIAE
jgi:hypothetical protein